MPNEADRDRAGEQEVNNAHQRDNDTRQKRNDTQQVNVSKERTQTQTNLEQGVINVDQLDTNTAQGVTNADQLDTNTAQGVTNTEQLDVNAGVRETIHLLARSVDANTLSMEAVSKALEENLRLYTKIDDRLTQAEKKTLLTEQRALAIEVKSDKRASTYRRLWGTLAVTVLVVGVGGFGLNAYRTSQLCRQRNEVNANNSALIQDDVDMLMMKDPTNPAIPGLQRYLVRAVQIDCKSLF